MGRTTASVAGTASVAAIFFVALVSLAQSHDLTSRGSPACIGISTIQDLDAVRNNLAGNYCLTANIDGSTVSEFIPIGSEFDSFKGTFDGAGYIIHDLNIRDRKATAVGLFGQMSGLVKNLTISRSVVHRPRANKFSSYTAVGLLAGIVRNGKVINCASDGKVIGRVGAFSWNGGLVGQLAAGEIIRSRSSAIVKGSIAGGLVGSSGGAKIRASYALGEVQGSTVGGLIGEAGDDTTIERSFADVYVEAGLNSRSGGLIGSASTAILTHITVTNVYSISRVSSEGGALRVHTSAGLIGESDETANLAYSYAAGPVVRSGRGNYYGLVGCCMEAAKASYWDIQATGQAASFAGKGLTTAELSEHLPKGFDPSVWAIVPGKSYPYLIGVTPDHLIPRPGD
jgi:hypothetical protein